MIQTFLPALASIVTRYFKEEEGFHPRAIEKLNVKLSSWLGRDQKVREELSQCMKDARAHDIATFDATDKFANRLRSSVRPVCTFTAVGWYIYARVNNIPLCGEDYAIIGGVLAFWFGFRPFEKRGANL